VSLAASLPCIPPDFSVVTSHKADRAQNGSGGVTQNLKTGCFDVVLQYCTVWRDLCPELGERRRRSRDSGQIIEQPPSNHPATTQQPPSNHSATTQQPLSNHSATTQPSAETLGCRPSAGPTWKIRNGARWWAGTGSGECRTLLEGRATAFAPLKMFTVTL
jgi:hypothetical protein